MIKMHRPLQSGKLDCLQKCRTDVREDIWPRVAERCVKQGSGPCPPQTHVMPEHYRDVSSLHMNILLLTSASSRLLFTPS